MNEREPASDAEQPGLRAAVTYLRPFDRGRMLTTLAGLGVFVVEQDGRPEAPATGCDADLTILVSRGRPDLELIRGLAQEPSILLVVVPSASSVGECLQAGAGFCIPEDQFLEAPRMSLSVAARLARQKRARGHRSAPSPGTFAFGGIVFSSESCSLLAGETRLPLSRAERDVLLCLAAEPGVPVRSEVLASAARIGKFPTSRYLGSVIVRLRRKLRQLGADGASLATVHGVGYVLLAPGAAEQDAP